MLDESVGPECAGIGIAIGLMRAKAGAQTRLEWLNAASELSDHRSRGMMRSEVDLQDCVWTNAARAHRAVIYSRA